MREEMLAEYSQYSIFQFAGIWIAKEVLAIGEIDRQIIRLKENFRKIDCRLKCEVVEHGIMVQTVEHILVPSWNIPSSIDFEPVHHAKDDERTDSNSSKSNTETESY